MKRNLFPLLGIAFVVAVAATGVFYGLFVGKASGAATAPAAASSVVVLARPVERGMILTAEDVKVMPAGATRPAGAYVSVDDVVGRTVAKAMPASEVVTAAALLGGSAGGGLPIPKGMRAISIRVVESVGLVPYLRPGNHVDVQVVENRAGEMAAKTLLSNVTVLTVHVDPNPQAGPVTIVNLLVPARDVERVALADSTARVRIVLRSQADDDADVAPPAVAVRPAANGNGAVPGGTVAANGPASSKVSFSVRMAAATAEAVREMTSQAGLQTPPESPLRIGLLPEAWKAEELGRAKAVRLLATETVDSAHWHEISLQAGGGGNGDYDLRLRLTPRGAPNGRLRLRVKPELTLPLRGGVSSRRFMADVEVAEGQSVLVAGFERDAAVSALVEKLFRTPGLPAATNELMLVVTPHLAAR